MTDETGRSAQASNVVSLNVAPMAPLPAREVSPAEKGLKIVQSALIQQLGPVQAYNALVQAAGEIRAEIAKQRPVPTPPKDPAPPERTR